jgi:hypothetical protein
MGNAQFLAGKLHTGFLAEQAEDLASRPIAPDLELAAMLAAAFTDIDFRRLAYDVPEPYASIGFWRN